VVSTGTTMARAGSHRYRPLFADTPQGRRSRSLVRFIVYFLILGIIVGTYIAFAYFAAGER